jgi:OFA family oxalate/formate antiporter-like MFS transporter
MTEQDRRAWSIAGALFVSLFFLWGAGYDCFPIFIPSMIRQFHITRLQAGMVPAAQAITAGICGIAIGWLLDRVPAQVVMAVGAILTAAGILMMSQAASLDGLIVGSVVTGVGMIASTLLPSTMVISNWFGEKRGAALGITTAGMELGGMVMTIVAGRLIGAHGWRFAYAAVSVPLMLLVAPIYLIFVRTRPASAAIRPASARDSAHTDTAAALPGLEVAEAVQTRAFWMLAVLQFCYTFAVGGSFIHLVQYLIGIGYAQSVGTIVVGVSLGLALIGKPMMGVLGDKIGGKNALALCLLLGAFNTALLLEAQIGWIVAVFTVVGGITGAAPIALGPLVQVETLGLRRYGSIAGLLGISFTLGATLGPLMVGKIADAAGGYPPAFEVCAILSAIGAVAAFLCVAPAGERIGILLEAD